MSKLQFARYICAKTVNYLGMGFSEIDRQSFLSDNMLGNNRESTMLALHKN